MVLNGVALLGEVLLHGQTMLWLPRRPQLLCHGRMQLVSCPAPRGEPKDAAVLGPVSGEILLSLNFQTSSLHLNSLGRFAAGVAPPNDILTLTSHLITFQWAISCDGRRAAIRCQGLQAFALPMRNRPILSRILHARSGCTLGTWPGAPAGRTSRMSSSVLVAWSTQTSCRRRTVGGPAH